MNKETDNFVLSEEEMIAAIPRLKSHLQGRVKLSKEMSDKKPSDVLLALKYREDSIDLRVFLWSLETAGRMARTAQAFQEALNVSVQENRALASEFSGGEKKETN